MLKTYIAGPFFTDEQKAVVDKIKETCVSRNVEVFSPKDECIYVKGVTDPFDILQMNVDAIDGSDFIIVITDGKDVGTMFEAGYAFANNVAIVYVWLSGRLEDKFNLMLNESAHAVCRSYEELQQVVTDFMVGGIKRVESTVENLI